MTVTTTDHAAWARGATAPVTLPPAPAPPAPPTYFPPTAEGGRPGRGPRRRFQRWIVAALVLVAVAAAGVGGGWALRGANTPESATQPSTANATPDLNPTDARKQTCDAYAALGTQWSQAYHAWLPSVSGVNWHWEDAPVADATRAFSEAQTQIVIQLRSLVAPGTPGDVSTAVNAYTSSILSLGAALGNASGPDTTSRIDAVDAASATANKVCSF
ncbi:hypothetical protein BH09ACT7_BH09ACT7_54370 [soil metagenome]